MSCPCIFREESTCKWGKYSLETNLNKALYSLTHLCGELGQAYPLGRLIPVVGPELIILELSLLLMVPHRGTHMEILGGSHQEDGQ